MSKELDIVLEKVYGHTDLTKVVREDTYTSLRKIGSLNEGEAWDAFKQGWGKMLRGDFKGSFAKGVQQVHAMRKNIDRGLDMANKARNDAADYLDPSSKKPSGDITPTSSGGSTGGSTGDTTPTSSGGSTGKVTSPEAKPPATDTKPPEAPKPEAPKQTTPEAPKPEAPKQPEAPATKAPETKTTSSFKQAYADARKAAKAAGKNPNIAQFKWTDKTGKEGTYQAAATKKDYVKMSKQFKTDVGSKPKSEPAPKADDNKPSSTETTPKAPETVTSPASRRVGATPEGPSSTNPKDIEKANADANANYEKEAGRKPIDPVGTVKDKANDVMNKVKDVLDTKPKKDIEGSVDTQKESAKLNECVQVGNYKYRII